MKERNDICLSILLAMDTGMTIGEISALKVEDVILDPNKRKGILLDLIKLENTKGQNVKPSFD